MSLGEYSGEFPQAAQEVLMAFVDFFADESGKYGDHEYVALSGVISTRTRVHKFNQEWSNLLRVNGIPSLHMKRASRLAEDCGLRMLKGQTLAQRTAALIPFAQCIRKHFEIGLIQAWFVPAWREMPSDARMRLGNADDPSYVMFLRAAVEAVGRLRATDSLMAICDDDEGGSLTFIRHYHQMLKAMPELRKQIAAVALAKDEFFPGVQAADMVAFLTRHEARARFSGGTNEWAELLAGLTASSRTMQWFEVWGTKQVLEGMARDLLELPGQRADGKV